MLDQWTRRRRRRSGGGGGGVSISNQNAEFGGLTIASAGGWKPVDSNGDEVDIVSITPISGTTSGWSVSSGRMIRSSTPATSHGATFTVDTALGSIVATIVASGTDANGNNLAVARSVATTVQLENAIEAASLAYGDRILCRTASYGDPAIDLRCRPVAGCPIGTFTPPSDLPATVTIGSVTHNYRGPDMTTGNYVVITPHVGATAIIARLAMDGITEAKGGFMFKGMELFASSASDLSDSTRNAGGIVRLMNDIENIAFYQCEIHSTPEASANNGYRCYPGITTDTGAAFPDFKVIDCEFYDVWTAIISGDQMNNCDLVGNDIRRVWNDHLKLIGGDYFRFCWNIMTDKKSTHRPISIVNITRGASTVIELTAGEITLYGIAAADDVTFVNVGGTTELNGNTYNIASVNAGANTITLSLNSSGFGAYTSGGTALWVEAHGDFLQMRTPGFSFDSWLLCGNLAWRGDGTDPLTDGQGFFAPSDGANPEAITNFVSVFNAYQGTFVGGLSMTQLVDPIVRGNVAISDRVFGGGTSTQISFLRGSGAVVKDNISCAAISFTSHTPTEEANNYIASSTLTSGATSYEELFANYLSGSGMTDPATQLDLDPAGAAFALDPKAGIYSGYVNFATRTITAPHLASSAPVAGDITAAVVQWATPLSGMNTDMSGWVIAVTLKDLAANIGGTLDATKLSVDLTRPGYTTVAAATDVSFTLSGTKGFRRPVPPQWTAGLTIVAGNRITSAAKVSSASRIYVALNGGTTATAGPTHTSGDATGADGITWRYLTAADTTGATAVTSPYNIREYVEEVSGSDLIVYVCLSDYIFAPDTVATVAIASGFYTGSNASSITTADITNSSPILALKPDVAVTFMPWQLFGTTLSGGGVTAAHPYGRNSAPVACVKYEVFDSAGVTTGLTQTVSAMSINTTFTAYNRFDEFPVNMDISSLADGLYSLRFTVYTWAGGMFDSATDGFGTLVPTISTTMTANTAKAYPFRKDAAGTYGRAYAYVDESVGNDSTGVCSTNPATASASPFLTIQAAMSRAGNGLTAYSNTTFGRANCGNHVVRLKTDIANGFGATSVSSVMGDVWLTIESDPALGTQVNWTPSATSANRVGPKRAKYSNVKMTATATPVIDNIASATTGAFAWEQWTDLCNFIGGGSRCWQRQGLMYVTNTIVDTCGIMGAENTVTGIALYASCNIKGTSCRSSSPNVLGCRFETGAIAGIPNVTRWGETGPGSVTGLDTIFYLNNSWFTEASNVLLGVATIRGVSWIGNIIEATSTVPSGKGFELWADNSSIPIGHMFYGFNTSVGDGYNIAYNEVGSAQVAKPLIFAYYNAGDDRNSKQDWYDLTASTVNANRTGAMAYHHMVGCHDNVIFAPTSALEDPRNNVGEHKEPGTLLSGTRNYTDNRSRLSGGTTTGGGDYRPATGSSLRAMVGAAEQHYVSTQSGQTRKTDGEGAAGAFEGTW